MAMWRERYEKQLEPVALRRSSFADWSETFVAVAEGRLTYSEAYGQGFDGAKGSPYYFVGMEMLRAVIEHRGRAYLDTVYSADPKRFAKDYAALAAKEPSLPQLSVGARTALDSLPDTW